MPKGVADSIVEEDRAVEIAIVKARKNSMEHLFDTLREHINQWMSHALGRLFCASRLDQPLAFGLAVNLPLSMSGSQLRQIVAANPRAANKIQVRLFSFAHLKTSLTLPSYIDAENSV